MLGDSTMQFNDITTYPQFGWGQVLNMFTKRDVLVLDFAKNGRSTKSFIAEGLLDEALSYVSKDDYVICQFGHNDEKLYDKTRGTAKDGEYIDNLRYIFTEVKKRGANIVYATSITRRKFVSGVCKDSHQGYPESMKRFAKENNLVCIDLNTLTLNLYNQLGEEKTKEFHLIFGKGIYERYPEGKEDNSHLTLKGALMVSELFVRNLKKTNSSLNDFFLDLDKKYEIDERMLKD